MGEIINPLKRKSGEPIKPVSLKEVLGKKEDMMNKLFGEKRNGSSSEK